MKANVLLEQIWGGSVTAWGEGEKGEIARGIAALLPVETVCVSNAAPHAGPRVLPEATELLPGLSLGDVLAEELGISVPFGAVVVFETVGGGAAVARAEGEMRYAGPDALQHVASASRGGAAASAAAGREPRRAPVFRDDGLNAHFFGGARADGGAETEGTRQLLRGDRAIG